MALLRDTAEPLYLQIRDLILADVMAGRLAAHQRLPSERELSVKHGVSRMTVRQAIVDLQRSGAVYARVGKGTFVAPPKIDQQLRSVTSFTSDVRARGGHAASRVLRAIVEPASIDVARALDLAEGAPVITLSRVRLADGDPLAIETAHLPYDLFSRLLDHDFSRESLYEVLSQDYRLTLSTASQTIQAGLADPHELELLGTEHPAAVLRMERVTCAESGRPVEFVVSTYRGDRYQLRSQLETARLATTVG